jgi:hypothetical protein
MAPEVALILSLKPTSFHFLTDEPSLKYGTAVSELLIIIMTSNMQSKVFPTVKMASPTAESVRSPLDSVFHILPQGHDKPLKQAFYNTAATLFILVVCCAAVAVYYILEAFLRPLLWAVLCGTFLHPFKNKLSSIIRGWLKSLRESGTPLVVGTLLIPVQVVDYSSETIGSFLVKHYKAILALAFVLPGLYCLYHFGLLLHIFNIVKGTFSLVYDILGCFSALWVCIFMRIV